MIKVDEDFTMDVVEEIEEKPQIKREPLDESLVNGGWVVLSETESVLSDTNIKKKSANNIKVEPDSQEISASVPNENLIKREPESLESNNSLDNVRNIKTENDLGGTNMSPSNPKIQKTMDTSLIDLTLSEDTHVLCNKKSTESNINSECHLKESLFHSCRNDHSTLPITSGRPTVIKINDRCITNNGKIKEEITDVIDIIDLTEDSHLLNNPFDNCGAQTSTKINIILDKVINLNPEQTQTITQCNNLPKSDLKDSIQRSTEATPRNLNSETVDTNIHCSKSLDNNILKNNISDRSWNPLPAESTNRKRCHSSQEDLTGSKERNNQTKTNVSKVISMPKPDISQMYLYAPPKKPRKDDGIKLNQNEKIILSKIEGIPSNLKRNHLEKSISNGEKITLKTAPEERNSNRNPEIFHSDTPQTEAAPSTSNSEKKLQESITNKEKGTQGDISKKGSSNQVVPSKKEDKKIVNGAQNLEKTDLSRNRERDKSSETLLNKNNDTSSNNVKTSDKSSSVAESKQENNKRIVKLLKCFLQERNVNEMAKIGATLKELLDQEDSDNEENPERVLSNESPPTSELEKEVMSNGEAINREPEDAAIDYSMKERLVNVDKSVTTESVKINSLAPNMTSVCSFSPEIISPTQSSFVLNGKNKAPALGRSEPSEKSKNTTKVAVVNKQNSIANELAKKKAPLQMYPLPASSVSSHPLGKMLPPNSSSAFALTTKKESFRNGEAIKNRETQVVNKSTKDKVSSSTDAPSVSLLSSQMAPKKNLQESLSKSKDNNLYQRRDNETIKEKLGINGTSVSNGFINVKDKNILLVNPSTPTFGSERSSSNIPASKDMKVTPRKRQPTKERSQDAKRILNGKKESFRNGEAIKNRETQIVNKSTKDKVPSSTHAPSFSLLSSQMAPKKNLQESLSKSKDSNLLQRRDNETIKEKLGINRTLVSNGFINVKDKNILPVNPSTPTFGPERSSSNISASKDMKITPRKRKLTKEGSQDAKRILKGKKETSQRHNEAVNKKPQYRQSRNIKDKNSVVIASNGVKISCRINREVAKENLGSNAEPEKANLSVSSISAEIADFLSKNEISITLTQSNHNDAENKKKPQKSSNCDRFLHLNPPKSIPNREENKQLDQTKVPNSNRPKQNSKRKEGKNIENKTDTGSTNVKTSIKKADTTSSRKIASNLHLSVRNLPSHLRKNIVDAFTKASSSGLAQVCKKIDAMIEDSAKSPKEKTQSESADPKSSACNRVTSTTTSSSLTSIPQAHSFQTSTSATAASGFEKTATASSNMIRKRQEVQHPSGFDRVSAKTNVELSNLENRSLTITPQAYSLQTSNSATATSNFEKTATASSNMIRKRQEVQHPSCSDRVSAKANVELSNLENRSLTSTLQAYSLQTSNSATATSGFEKASTASSNMIRKRQEVQHPSGFDRVSAKTNVELSNLENRSLTSTLQAYSLQTSTSATATSNFEKTATASSNMLRKRQEVQHPSGSDRVSARANVELSKLENRRISEPLNLRKQNSHLSRSSDFYVRSGGASSHNKEKEFRCSSFEHGAPHRVYEGKERCRNNEHRAPQISKEKFTNSKNVENRNCNKKENPRCLNYEQFKSLPDKNNAPGYSISNVPRRPNVRRRKSSMSSNTRPGVSLSRPKRSRICYTNTRKNGQNGRNINTQRNVQEVLMPQYSWNDLVLPAGGTLQIPEEWQNYYKNYNLACTLLQQHNQ